MTTFAANLHWTGLAREMPVISQAELPVVSIVEDDKAITQLIRTSLKSLECIFAEYADLQEFMNRDSSGLARPGCVILDVYLPDGNALDILEKRSESHIPQYLPIIYITGQGDIPMAVDSMSRGAWSFLPKPLDLGNLRSMVTKAVEWSVQQRSREESICQARANWDSLTEQEKLVARFMLASVPNKNIASRMDVSIRTVEARRHSVFEKLKVDGLCEFAQLATTLGIYPDPETN